MNVAHFGVQNCFGKIGPVSHKFEETKPSWVIPSYFLDSVFLSRYEILFLNLRSKYFKIPEKLRRAVYGSFWGVKQFSSVLFHVFDEYTSILSILSLYLREQLFPPITLVFVGFVRKHKIQVELWTSQSCSFWSSNLFSTRYDQLYSFEGEKRPSRVIPSFFWDNIFLDRNKSFFVNLRRKYFKTPEKLRIAVCGSFWVAILFSAVSLRFRVFDKKYHFRQFCAYFLGSHFFPHNVLSISYKNITNTPE